VSNGTVVEGAKCRVMGAGQVNCSRAVYRNSKVWRRSKQHIDDQINKLREQLEALKVRTFFEIYFTLNYFTCIMCLSVGQKNKNKIKYCS
jgi:hypothetical protein